MAQRKALIAPLLAVLLIQTLVPGRTWAGKGFQPAGEKVKVSGYILALKGNRIRVDDSWVRLPEGTKIYRRGSAWIEASELRLGWLVVVSGRRVEGSDEIAARKVTVRTMKNAKSKLAGILEICGQSWEDFSVPEVRWSEEMIDEENDETGDEDGAEGFNDLRERDLEIQGRPVEFTEDAQFYGRSGGAIPFRLLYPGILVETTGRMDEETGRFRVDTLRAEYERPDPLEYQIRQESQLEIAKLHPGIKLYTEPTLLRKLDKVGARLIPPYAYLPQEAPSFRFEVLATEEPISFCMPGGTIYVSAGLLSLLRSEEELAAILAHEIAHVCLRHFIRGIEEKQRISVIDLGTFAGIIAFGPVVSVLGPMFKVATYKGLRVIPFAMLHGYSDRFEYEADAYAADFLHRAGYHPGSLLRLPEVFEGLYVPPRGTSGSKHPFFWLDERRWEKRFSQLRRQLALRYPAALDYEARPDPAFKEKTRRITELVLEKLKNRPEESPFASRLLSRISGSEAKPSGQAGADGS